MSLRFGSRQEAEAATTLQRQEHRGRLLTPQAHLIPEIRNPTS